MKPSLAAVAGLLMSACSSALEDPGIRLLETNTTVVGARPDSVVVSVTFANLSDRPITFRGGGRWTALDLEVRDSDGDFVWQYLLDRIVGQPATPYTVSAGARETWTVVWPIVDRDGERVSPGTYRLVAFLGDDPDIPVQRSPEQTVTVP